MRYRTTRAVSRQEVLYLENRLTRVLGYYYSTSDNSRQETLTTAWLGCHDAVVSNCNFTMSRSADWICHSWYFEDQFRYLLHCPSSLPNRLKYLISCILWWRFFFFKFKHNAARACLISLEILIFWGILVNHIVPSWEEENLVARGVFDITRERN